jgi:hypothetical protein
MSHAAWTGVLTAVCLLLAVLVIPVRREVLRRRGGLFDCSLRTDRSRQGRGWMIGVGLYAGDAIAWYRVFSYSPRPKRVIRRRSLDVIARRAPTGIERGVLLAGSVILECVDSAGPLELAMPESALTGFLSWLESAPPGTDVHVA